MLEYIKELKEELDRLDVEKVNGLAKRIVETSSKGNDTYIIGNGGSAVTASHWACDLNKGILSSFYNPNQRRLKVTSLTDNVAILTAMANDLGYEEIFSQQIRNRIKKDDLLITMSGSGKSKNIIYGSKTAKEKGAYIFSLLGFDGGEMIHISDDYIKIDSKNYGIIEDIFSSIGHLITMKIKNEENRHL